MTCLVDILTQGVQPCVLLITSKLSATVPSIVVGAYFYATGQSNTPPGAEERQVSIGTSCIFFSDGTTAPSLNGN